MPLVAVIAGSKSDEAIVQKAIKVLEEHKISYDYQVLSAHRNPDELDKYIRQSDAKVLISTANDSLFFLESRLESLTPIKFKFFNFFSSKRTPTITKGPITHPLPASSTPTTFLNPHAGRGPLQAVQRSVRPRNGRPDSDGLQRRPSGVCPRRGRDRAAGRG